MILSSTFDHFLILRQNLEAGEMLRLSSLKNHHLYVTGLQVSQNEMNVAEMLWRDALLDNVGTVYNYVVYYRNV